MPPASRFERLRKLTRNDLNALPDRPAKPEPEEPVSDEDYGGVSLNPATDSPRPIPQSKQAVRVPSPTPPTAHEENTERKFVWLQGQQSSYNLGSAPKLSTLPTSKLPPATLRKGDLVPAQDHFTPIIALSKYPYHCVNRNLSQDLATQFWDQGKFWNREWDLYYVWDTNKDKPLILVSESQFQDLLKEVNSALKLGLKITDQQREDGLVSRFPDHPHCRPRYLGRSYSKEEFNDMVGSVPGTDFRAPEEPLPPPISSGILEDFRQMLEELWELQKGKSKAQKIKKQEERVAKQQGMSNAFKRVQRYLGLRPTFQGVPAAQAGSGMPTAVDASSPTPFPFDHSVVFVCVDVESHERAHHKITEIGIATLDTRDLVDVAPGNDGENWRSKIRARHFRIKEHCHLVNHEFVHGCPERFDFGTSEFCSLDDAKAKVGACFKPPFCALPEDGDEAYFVNLGEQRNTILLGHDTVTDIRYLSQLGFNPLELPNILETQDTATMYRVWKREPNPTSLGKILLDFEIVGWNLHNAGNDAVYTVQSMLAVCVREATIRGTPALDTMHKEDQAAKIAKLKEEAEQKVKEEAEGWSDVEGNDGGAPERPVKKERQLEPAQKPATSQVNGNVAVTFDAPIPIRGRGQGRSDGSGPMNTFHTRGSYENPEGSRGSAHSRYRHPGRPRVQSAERGYHRGVSRGRGRPRGVGRAGRARARGSTESRSEGAGPNGGWVAAEHQIRYDLI